MVREYFAPREAGVRVGIVLMSTLLGMALGGWISGAIFDVTGSYQAAFVNGLAWNIVNIVIIAWLLLRALRPAWPRICPFGHRLTSPNSDRSSASRCRASAESQAQR